MSAGMWARRRLVLAQCICRAQNIHRRIRRTCCRPHDLGRLRPGRAERRRPNPRADRQAGAQAGQPPYTITASLPDTIPDPAMADGHESDQGMHNEQTTDEGHRQNILSSSFHHIGIGVT
jgi:hypothetical protein